MRDIVGIGIDIEDIDRFAKLDLKKDRIFFDKIYTPAEIKYCFSKSNPYQHLAARFAGKEAVIKALNSISISNINYNEIEIINNKKGIPQVTIKNKNLNNIKIQLSLSHCKDKALAFAILINSPTLKNGKDRN